MTTDDSRYSVRIVPRGFYMSNDDWHATVTRVDDGKELIFISGWLRLLKWRVRRPALDRAFRRSDRYAAEMARAFATGADPSEFVYGSREEDGLPRNGAIGPL